MTPLTFVLLSGTLSFGVPLALAVRELLTLCTVPRGGDEPPSEEPFAGGRGPLPDCLFCSPSPVRDPLRVRALEDA